MGAVGGGAMDATASALAQGKNLGLALEKGKGVERGSSTSAARAKGEETGKEGGEARSVGSSRLRRGGSASNLGVRARERRRVAIREAPGRPQGRGEGWGAARGRRPRRPAVNGDERREQRRDGVDGSLIINSKFQNAVCKISFPPSISPQMKNF